MDNLIKKTQELYERYLEIRAALDIDGKIAQLKEKQSLMSEPDFWQDQASAVKVSQLAEALQAEVKVWRDLDKEISEALELMALAGKDNQENWEQELEQKYKQLFAKFSKLEFISLFSGPYDKYDAIISIHAGTGGVDAQDFAQMLERMYFRFAEKNGFKVEIIDRNYGNEAGLKNMMAKISGPYAYGYLQSENGVHRLLRVSPFDGENLRHTSFALVEVMPDLPEAEEMLISEEDLRWDVYRSSGPGGQSVNTTDSAVRLTHLPSGIVVSCQTERSQHQNRENALKILKSKLYRLALEEKSAAERKLKGEVQKAEWGKQIRSYFLYGNRLVKDHRSNYESRDPEAVLDGDLIDFMEAYLRFVLANRKD